MLTYRQKQFVNEYPKDFNATKAAIRAGYSPRSAYNQAYRLMRNDELIKCIDELFDSSLRVLSDTLNSTCSWRIKLRAADKAIYLWLLSRGLNPKKYKL